MNNLASIAKKGPSWTREFDSLIRAIGECKSKAEEDAIISREVIPICICNEQKEKCTAIHAVAEFSRSI